MKKCLAYLCLIFLLTNCTPKNNLNSNQNNESPIPIAEKNIGVESSKLGGIKGIIANNNTNKKSNALSVELYQGQKQSASIQADESGEFKIENVELGSYTLRINDGRFNVYQKANLVIEKDTILDLGTINIQPIRKAPAKPIIYLYPTEPTDVQVKVEFKGQLTHTYPKYPKDGWKVRANPDGTLFDESGKEYYALFWEGKGDGFYTLNDGFVVQGQETVAFLEDALDKLGLNRREANEFIMYWMPIMENNPYNLIHFSTTEYEEMAALHITPTPETVIRVMMVFKPLDEPISIPKQNLSAMGVKRKGFTVVEWGGNELPKAEDMR